MSQIQFQHLEFSYFEDSSPVFRDFSAAFDSEKITILTGRSGCGKSTLLYLAAGLYPQNGGFIRGGQVLLDGRDPDKIKPLERCRLVTMMFQNPELQFCMDTVRNELIFCLENIQEKPENFEARMASAAAFTGISHLMDRSLVSLSGGEKQKVMLACLIMLEPDWLLLDEPFANIDNDSAQDIALSLKRLHEEKGTGILAVDHRLDNWLEVADTVRVLEEGRLLEEAMPVRSLDPVFLEDHGIIIPGRSYEASLPPCQEGGKVLELKDFSLSYGDKTILSDVNITFKRGVITAIVGRSGCGKSSLFNALAGITKFKGQALLEGRDIRHLKKEDVGKMGFVTQSPQDQFIGGTVRQEILSSLKKETEKESLSEQILRGIKLWRFRDISPYLLSQGQQRRLGVAALMAYPCRVLICDEPTYAQDRINTLAIMEGLCRQAREKNAALIFSTHDPQLAMDFCDEIYRLENGTLIREDKSPSGQKEAKG